MDKVVVKRQFSILERPSAQVERFSGLPLGARRKTDGYRVGYGHSTVEHFLLPPTLER
jgi:hypothetical protein